jgi:HAD superfamily hydrolase (TIGR01509 family)
MQSPNGQEFKSPSDEPLSMTTEYAIRAVVFDLDGLMFNTEELYVEVGSEVLRRRGKQFTPELVDAMMGLRPAQAIGRMIEWHKLADTVEEIERESRKIFAPLLDTQLQPMPGLLPLLTALESAGIPKAVATSSDRAFVDEVLGRFDLGPRFQFLLTAEDVEQGKPNPEIYLRGAERFGLVPREMLAFEDSQTGLAAAVASGARVVAVPGGHSAHHDFSAAELIAASLSDARIYQMLSLPRP